MASGAQRTNIGGLSVFFGLKDDVVALMHLQALNEAAVKAGTPLETKHFWCMFKDVCGEDTNTFKNLLAKLCSAQSEFAAVEWPIRRCQDQIGNVNDYIRQW